MGVKYKTTAARRRFLPSPRILAAVLLCLLSSAFCFARADSLEEQFKSDYVGKTMTLRHFYSGEHLRFHSDGTLQGEAPTSPWTLDGQIEVEAIHLRDGLVVISGRRIRLIFNAQGNSEDELTTIDNYQGKSREKLEKMLRNLKVEIEIELPREKPDDIASVIQAVFLAKSESMMDIVPAWWQAYFAKREGRPRPVLSPIRPVYPVRPGKISAPHESYAPNPEYSDEARQAKLQGTVVLYLVVDASGTPRDLQVMVPLGLGLDEKAIETVSTWKFDPGQKEGEPVSVAVNVRVSFRLY
jgi:TonB family protein